MGYINLRIQRLKARLARIQALLSALYDTQAALSASTTDSYKFDSGEGSQQVTRKKLYDVNKQIEILEAEEEHYYGELYNVGLVNIGVRRIKPCR